MNAIIENLLTRRSTRAFLQKEIPDNELNEILQAAIYAPSGMGKQTLSLRFSAIRKKSSNWQNSSDENLDERAMICTVRRFLSSLPTKKKIHTVWKTMHVPQNIFLAAHSFGIGSVWINQLRTLCDDPEVRALLDEFEIPSDHVVYGMAALGYPADAPKKEIHKIGEIRIIK